MLPYVNIDGTLFSPETVRMVRLAGTFGFHFGTLRRRSPSLQARLAIEALRILRMWGEGRRTVVERVGNSMGRFGLHDVHGS